MTSKLIIAMLLLPACLVAQSFDYEIRGSIKNYRPGQKLYFMHFENGEKIDAVPIVNGNFSFKGKANLSPEPDEHSAQSTVKLYLDTKGKDIDFKRMPAKKLKT